MKFKSQRCTFKYQGVSWATSLNSDRGRFLAFSLETNQLMSLHVICICSKRILNHFPEVSHVHREISSEVLLARCWSPDTLDAWHALDAKRHTPFAHWPINLIAKVGFLSEGRFSFSLNLQFRCFKPQAFNFANLLSLSIVSSSSNTRHFDKQDPKAIGAIGANFTRGKVKTMQHRMTSGCYKVTSWCAAHFQGLLCPSSPLQSFEKQLRNLWKIFEILKSSRPQIASCFETSISFLLLLGLTSWLHTCHSHHLYSNLLHTAHPRGTYQSQIIWRKQTLPVSQQMQLWPCRSEGCSVFLLLGAAASSPWAWGCAENDQFESPWGIFPEGFIARFIKSTHHCNIILWFACEGSAIFPFCKGTWVPTRFRLYCRHGRLRHRSSIYALLVTLVVDPPSGQSQSRLHSAASRVCPQRPETGAPWNIPWNEWIQTRSKIWSLKLSSVS